MQHTPPPLEMLKMVMGPWVAQALGAVARLNVSDHLAQGPLTAEQLATKTGANPDALHRVMRALSSLGVYTMQNKSFGLTPLGQTLQSDVPGSMRNIVIAETDTCHWLTWGRFPDAVKTGRGMAQEALGMLPWDYYGKHPQDGEQFSRAMADISGIAIEPVLSNYDFSGAKTVVDVGGAHGALLLAVLRKIPAAKGILFDLPHVTATAKTAVANAGMANRVEIIAGDFFNQVPPGGDVYLLKHILHDWDDDHAVNILKSVRSAMQPQSKLLIVEIAMRDDAEPSPAHLMDLNMLVMVSGRERTPEQYGELLVKAGLTMARFIPTPSPMGLIEATPA